MVTDRIGDKIEYALGLWTSLNLIGESVEEKAIFQIKLVLKLSW